MRTTRSRIVLTAGSLAMLLGIVGCGAGEGTGSDGETVAIDVGNDMTIDLQTDRPLKVAVFVPGVANQYGQAQEAAANDTAEALGIDMTLFDAGYDANNQLNQMQTALQSGGFDAAVVQPVDGTVICTITTEDYPRANILVSNSVTTLCDYGTDQTGESPEEIWAPGTMNIVGSNNTLAYIDGWFQAAAEENPGEQDVLVVLGPAVAAQTRVIQVALDKFIEENPQYTVSSIHTDYSSVGAYNETQTYLQGNPDTTLILSIYTPDISEGILNAVTDAGLLGKVNVVDQGFGSFSLEQIEAGNIQFSTLFFPYNSMKLAIESLVAAQETGEPGPRFVDDSVVGTAEQPFRITRETIADLPAELR